MRAIIVVVDDELRHEGLEGQGLDDKEVGGPDRLIMVGKEGAPVPGFTSWV
jgi:hypothetical protein